MLKRAQKRLPRMLLMLNLKQLPVMTNLKKLNLSARIACLLRKLPKRKRRKRVLLSLSTRTARRSLSQRLPIKSLPGS